MYCRRWHSGPSLHKQSMLPVGCTRQGEAYLERPAQTTVVPATTSAPATRLMGAPLGDSGRLALVLLKACTQTESWACFQRIFSHCLHGAQQSADGRLCTSAFPAQRPIITDLAIYCAPCITVASALGMFAADCWLLDSVAWLQVVSTRIHQ